MTCDGLASRPGGVEILLAASCYGNWDKLRPDEPDGSIRLSHLSVSNVQTTYAQVMPKHRPFVPTGDGDECPNFLLKCTE